MGGTLRPKAGGGAPSEERRSPLARRSTDAGATTSFGSAGYAAQPVAAPAYAPAFAEPVLPPVRLVVPAVVPAAAPPSGDDFAARVAIARATGDVFVPIVLAAGAANATGFTAASPRVGAAAADGSGNADDIKAVADGNGCVDNDFSARIFRARSSGALSSGGDN
jgi:hypothetical protein